MQAKKKGIFSANVFTPWKVMDEIEVDDLDPQLDLSHNCAMAMFPLRPLRMVVAAEALLRWVEAWVKFTSDRAQLRLAS